ncbi:MAG: isoprenylcysteine carboxylmethyltransferase family protein [Acidobacteriia bacterium]|nr:isoprenylcysteine carboxylmethyltransferase family protein [Terriglobia bacterium]
MVLFKTALFTVLGPGTVTILVPYYLLSSRTHVPPMNLGILRYFGVLPIIGGALVYLRCALDFAIKGRGTPAPVDPPKELVVRGLYRYVRNPMYIGVALVVLGEAVFFRARILFEYAAIAFIFFHLFVLIYEEPILRRKFRESYDRYCRSVPRWVPRMRGYINVQDHIGR